MPAAKKGRRAATVTKPAAAKLPISRANQQLLNNLDVTVSLENDTNAISAVIVAPHRTTRSPNNKRTVASSSQPQPLPPSRLPPQRRAVRQAQQTQQKPYESELSIKSRIPSRNPVDQILPIISPEKLRVTTSTTETSTMPAATAYSHSFDTMADVEIISAPFVVQAATLLPEVPKMFDAWKVQPAVAATHAAGDAVNDEASSAADVCNLGRPPTIRSSNQKLRQNTPITPLNSQPTPTVASAINNVLARAEDRRFDQVLLREAAVAPKSKANKPIVNRTIQNSSHRANDNSNVKVVAAAAVVLSVDAGTQPRRRSTREKKPSRSTPAAAGGSSFLAHLDDYAVDSLQPSALLAATDDDDHDDDDDEEELSSTSSDETYKPSDSGTHANKPLPATSSYNSTFRSGGEQIDKHLHTEPIQLPKQFLSGKTIERQRQPIAVVDACKDEAVASVSNANDLRMIPFAVLLSAPATQFDNTATDAVIEASQQQQQIPLLAQDMDIQQHLSGVSIDGLHEVQLLPRREKSNAHTTPSTPNKLIVARYADAKFIIPSELSADAAVAVQPASVNSQRLLDTLNMACVSPARDISIAAPPRPPPINSAMKLNMPRNEHETNSSINFMTMPDASTATKRISRPERKEIRRVKHMLAGRARRSRLKAEELAKSSGEIGGSSVKAVTNEPISSNSNVGDLSIEEREKAQARLKHNAYAKQYRDRKKAEELAKLSTDIATAKATDEQLSSTNSNLNVGSDSNLTASTTTATDDNTQEPSKEKKPLVKVMNEKIQLTPEAHEKIAEYIHRFREEGHAEEEASRLGYKKYRRERKIENDRLRRIKLKQERRLALNDGNDLNKKDADDAGNDDITKSSFNTTKRKYVRKSKPQPDDADQLKTVVRKRRNSETDFDAAAEKPIKKRRRSSFPLTKNEMLGAYPNLCHLGKENCCMSFAVEKDDEENRMETAAQVQCYKCKQFVHICCINKAFGVMFEKRAQFDRFEEFHCPRCSPRELKTKIYELATNNHRHNAWEEDPPAELQTASPKFVETLMALEFPDARTHPVMLHMHGREVQMDFLEQHGFRVPILVEEPTGLSLVVPESDPKKTVQPFTYDKVLELCGRKRRVNCIDSRAQERYNLDLEDFVDYITGRKLQKQKLDRSILLNVVSLEFADVTEMKKLFVPPAVVLEMSWADCVMPKEKRIIIPNAQKYMSTLNVDYESDYSVEYFCLMGAAGSFTDFHIDFGGSCVFYHIMRGTKVFYVAPPTPENMQRYKQYEASEGKTSFADGSDNFFKLMEAAKAPVYRLELRAGNTVFLPAGWIHSVLTPEDSLVFGGNFLNHLCIPTQLEIFNMEEALAYPRSDRYHNFEINCVYAIDDLVFKLRVQEMEAIRARQLQQQQQKSIADDDDAERQQQQQKTPSPSSQFKQYLVHGLKILVDFIDNHWLKKNAEQTDLYKVHRRAELKRPFHHRKQPTAEVDRKIVDQQQQQADKHDETDLASLEGGGGGVSAVQAQAAAEHEDIRITPELSQSAAKQLKREEGRKASFIRSRRSAENVVAAVQTSTPAAAATGAMDVVVADAAKNPSQDKQIKKHYDRRRRRRRVLDRNDPLFDDDQNNEAQPAGTSNHSKNSQQQQQQEHANKRFRKNDDDDEEEEENGDDNADNVKHDALPSRQKSTRPKSVKKSKETKQKETATTTNQSNEAEESVAAVAADVDVAASEERTVAENSTAVEKDAPVKRRRGRGHKRRRRKADSMACQQGKKTRPGMLRVSEAVAITDAAAPTTVAQLNAESAAATTVSAKTVLIKKTGRGRPFKNPDSTSQKAAVVSTGKSDKEMVSRDSAQKAEQQKVEPKIMPKIVENEQQKIHRQQQQNRTRIFNSTRAHAERDGEREESVKCIVTRAKNFLKRLQQKYGVDINAAPEFADIPFKDYTADHVVPAALERAADLINADENVAVKLEDAVPENSSSLAVVAVRRSADRSSYCSIANSTDADSKTTNDADGRPVSSDTSYYSTYSNDLLSPTCETQQKQQNSHADDDDDDDDADEQLQARAAIVLPSATNGCNTSGNSGESGETIVELGGGGAEAAVKKEQAVDVDADGDSPSDDADDDMTDGSPANSACSHVATTSGEKQQQMCSPMDAADFMDT